jgi:hypothetical protein
VRILGQTGLLVSRRDWGFKVKGAIEVILREAAFTSSLVETVFKKQMEEILSDPAFVGEIILAHCQTASPSELRKMAAQDHL